MDQIGAVLVELDEPVLHVALGQRQQRDVARDAAVVEPVERHGRDAVALAAVVDADGDVVVAALHELGHVGLELREGALMADGLLAVHPDVGLVAHAAEADDVAAAGPDVELEVASVPDGSLVELQVLALRVPVARDLQRRGVVDGRLLAVVLPPGAVAAGESARRVVLVDHEVPLSVERRDLAGALARRPDCEVRREQDAGREQEGLLESGCLSHGWLSFPWIGLMSDSVVCRKKTGAARIAPPQPRSSPRGRPHWGMNLSV